MRMRLIQPGSNELIFEQNLPLQFKTEKPIGQAVVKINHAIGSATMQNAWFDGIYAAFGEVQLGSNLSLKAECDTPLIEMHFGISGNTEAFIRGARQRIQFNSGQHNVCYYPEFEGYINSGQSSGTYKMLEVNITESYFNRFANAESVLLNRFHEKIIKKQTSFLGPENLGTTPQMNRVLEELMTCTRQGIMKRLFLEARILELLMLQIEQFDSSPVTKRTPQFKAIDVDKIHQAKFIIEQNISSPYSLNELAREVGLNDFKLKKVSGRFLVQLFLDICTTCGWQRQDVCLRKRCNPSSIFPTTADTPTCNILQRLFAISLV